MSLLPITVWGGAELIKTVTASIITQASTLGLPRKEFIERLVMKEK